MRTAADNIRLLMILQILKSFLVMIPILVLFFQAKGLSMTDIMLIQAIFSAVMVIAEVPSGYFSDMLGRRRTMIIGTLCSTMGFGIYGIAQNTTHFIIAEIILAVGISFISGTDSAMLFDSLAETHQEAQSLQKEGQQLSVGNFSESLASIAGGFLAMISLDLPLFVQVFFTALSVPVAWLLVEPKRHIAVKSHTTMRGILMIVRETFLHKQLRALLLLSGIISAGTLTMLWFVQPVMKQAGVPLWLFGFSWAILNATAGFASFHAHRIEKYAGEKTFIVLSFLLFFSYMITGTIALWSIPFILLFSCIRGIGNPIATTYINRYITSDKRATILSVRMLIMRMIFVIIAPLMGYIADKFSLHIALYGCGLLFGILCVPAIIIWKKSLHESVL